MGWNNHSGRINDPCEDGGSVIPTPESTRFISAVSMIDLVIPTTAGGITVPAETTEESHLITNTNGEFYLPEAGVYTGLFSIAVGRVAGGSGSVENWFEISQDGITWNLIPRKAIFRETQATNEGDVTYSTVFSVNQPTYIRSRIRAVNANMTLESRTLDNGLTTHVTSVSIVKSGGINITLNETIEDATLNVAGKVKISSDVDLLDGDGLTTATQAAVKAYVDSLAVDYITGEFDWEQNEYISGTYTTYSSGKVRMSGAVVSPVDNVTELLETVVFPLAMSSYYLALTVLKGDNAAGGFNIGNGTQNDTHTSLDIGAASDGSSEFDSIWFIIEGTLLGGQAAQVIQNAIYHENGIDIYCDVDSGDGFHRVLATENSINQYANDAYQKIIDDGIVIGEYVSG